MGLGSSKLSNADLKSYGGLNSVKNYRNVRNQLKKVNANKRRLEEILEKKLKQAQIEIEKVRG